jgi:hypothetical protein
MHIYILYYVVLGAMLPDVFFDIPTVLGGEMNVP